MGVYLDSKTAYTLYKSETEKPYFVDKTRILTELFPSVRTGNNHICITRPRRFGKTVMANMIAAFFRMHLILGIFSGRYRLQRIRSLTDTVISFPLFIFLLMNWGEAILPTSSILEG